MAAGPLPRKITFCSGLARVEEGAFVIGMEKHRGKIGMACGTHAFQTKKYWLDSKNIVAPSLGKGFPVQKGGTRRQS
jgi:hypothetical protein